MSKERQYKYLYIGRRQIYDGVVPVVWHAFEKEGDPENIVYYSRSRGVYIGQTYLGGKASMPVRPERVDKGAIEITEDQLERFEVLDMAARDFMFARTAKKKADKEIEKLSKTKRIRSLKKEFQEITAGMNVFVRRAFINAMLREK